MKKLYSLSPLFVFLITNILVQKINAFDAEGFSLKLRSSIGCEHFRDLVWTEVYKQLESENLDSLSEKSRLKVFSDNPKLQNNAEALLNLLFIESRTLLNLHSKKELLEALSALELGDKSTPQKRILWFKAEKIFQSLEGERASLKSKCTNENENKINKQSKTNKSLAPSPGHGVYKTFATFYQSCSVLDLVPVKYADPGVEGISITGTHSDGVGKKRVVSSVSKVNATHHYLKNVSSYDSSCKNIKNSPPIYDYGGKPYATSALDSSLDFFKNAGSGTSALGIDCSGLVFANLASVGLKVKSSTALKAISVNGISSTMLSNPSSNGLDCLERVTFSASESIRPGDIISKPGHTVSIYSVEKDPFGIASISSSSSCTTSNISTSKFNFTIVQSAPIKNGIGVNRIPIADYLKLQSSWSNGLKHYAVKACKAKFGSFSSSASSDGLSIVRHKGTTNCISQPIVLNGESCAANCNPQTRSAFN